MVWTRTGGALIAAGLAAGFGVGVVASPARGQLAPACAPGTPRAVTFDGLRGRFPFGPPQIFALTETFEDWELEGEIAVRMADAASDEPFFEGTVTPDEELYVQLDLDDRPVAISATYAQREWYADAVDGTAATSCTMSLTALSRGTGESCYRRPAARAATGHGGSSSRAAMATSSCATSAGGAGTGR